MSLDQAKGFSEQWRVITQYNHTEQIPTYDDAGNLTGYVTNSNGLSVTVFEEVGTGKRYLAIRGTQDANDIITDLVSVAILGTPLFQSQYQSLRAKVQEWLTDGTLPQTFTVSGHSLGGFLATGLAGEFAANVEHTYLYNSPGLNGVLGGATAVILQALGITAPIDPATVSNLKADAGISPVAGLGAQVSPPISIAIENQFASDVDNPPAARNHSLQPLTDALALYATFATIAPGATVETVGKILKSASHQNKLTLESTLDSLRTLFQENYANGNTTANASTTPTGDREKFYTNLLALKDFLTASPFYNPDTKGLGFNLLSLADANATGLAASTKFSLAARYALLKLNPFLVAGNNDLYNQINSDHSLDLYDPNIGTGTLSEQYFKDRASFLTDKLWSGTNDRRTESQDAALFVRSGAPAYFEDRSGNTPYKLYQGLGPAVSGILTATMTQYLFGGSGTDSLTGGNEADHLYGMAGDDSLEGKKGNDYLEGGQGNDTYTYTTGDGLDTLLDTDGLGQITFDGAILNGGNKLFGETYKSADGNYLYTLLQKTTGQDLLISAMGGQMIVKDFQSGELGINLNDSTAPAPTSVFHGTANNDADLIDSGVPLGVAGGGVLDTNWRNYAAYGQVLYHDADDVGGMFFISRFGQPYPANTIFDALYGEGGDDYLLGNPGGHDFLIDGGVGE